MKRGQPGRERLNWFDVQNTTVGEGRGAAKREKNRAEEKESIQLLLFIMTGTRLCMSVCV